MHSTEYSSRIEVVIQLLVNGEARSFPATLSVAQLVESLDLAGKRIAVERNGEIVPRSHHADTALADGDRLEIVVAVGGG
jgi:sulfur carrier protein